MLPVSLTRIGVREREREKKRRSLSWKITSTFFLEPLGLEAGIWGWKLGLVITVLTPNLYLQLWVPGVHFPPDPVYS